MLKSHQMERPKTYIHISLIVFFYKKGGMDDYRSFLMLDNGNSLFDNVLANGKYYNNILL